MNHPEILKGGAPTPPQVAFERRIRPLTRTQTWINKVALIETNKSFRIRDAVVSAETMDDLPADVQTILKEAAREAGINTDDW